MSRCTVCNKEIDWEIVTELFEDDFLQADSFGMESLTEWQQLIIEGKICSIDCVENLS